MDLREEIHKMYKEIREKPEEFGCLKTDELLSAYEKEGNKYLENKTNKDIEEEKLASFDTNDCAVTLTKVERTALMKKLVGYRYVDEIDSLHIGKYTRCVLNDGGLFRHRDCSHPENMEQQSFQN